MLLTAQIGLPVVTARGETIGRVHDLTAMFGPVHPLVHRIVVSGPRREVRLLSWDCVAEYSSAHIVLRADSALPTPTGITTVDDDFADGELLLGRDVLDTQIIDLEGHRLSRVSDVVLFRRIDARLEVAAVDIGAGSLLRRMGVPILPRLLAPVAVDWENIHLASLRGHVIQLSTSSAAVHQLHGRGLAELLARLSVDKATEVMRTVGPQKSAEAVHRSHPFVGRRLLRALPPVEADKIVESASSEVAERRLAEWRKDDDPLRKRRFLRLKGWHVNRPPKQSEEAE